MEWSLRPRLDTYTISCNVKYFLDGEIYYDRIDIDIRISPSLGSMLAGTLVRYILGTLVKELFPRTGIMSDFANFGAVGTMNQFLPVLFSNLILGFIIAIVLMRKKDVQPFLTIEDFWGSILVGFLTSHTSSQILEQLSNEQIISI